MGTVGDSILREGNIVINLTFYSSVILWSLVPLPSPNLILELWSSAGWQHFVLEVGSVFFMIFKAS